MGKEDRSQRGMKIATKMDRNLNPALFEPFELKEFCLIMHLK